MEDEHLRALVWQWMDLDFYVKKVKKNEVELTRFWATKRGVDEVLAALTVDTAVMDDAMPTWLHPSFTDDGSPCWGQAVPSRRVNLTPVDDPQELIAFQNCLLDVESWINGELKVYGHNSRYFSATCLPFELPLKQLRSVEQAGEPEELLGALCPNLDRLSLQHQ